MNYGVGPHEIDPERKRAESFPGAEHPYGAVHHPGVKPHYMAEKAIETLDASLSWAAEPSLKRFARELEAEQQLQAGRIY